MNLEVIIKARIPIQGTDTPTLNAMLHICASVESKVIFSDELRCNIQGTNTASLKTILIKAQIRQRSMPCCISAPE